MQRGVQACGEARLEVCKVNESCSIADDDDDGDDRGDGRGGEA